MTIQADTLKETLELMRSKLSHLIPDAELQLKSELVFEINELKRERNAVILGHNYMEPVLFHTVPDIVGDSLELSRRAADTDKDVIIFCGVRFMAETAKILNPGKTVLLPATEAGCSLAASITVEDVRKLRERFPNRPIVTYINTYADIKAEVDICCTSGNAARVVQSLETESFIFLPDEYLAKNVANDMGRSVAVAYRENDGEIGIEGDPDSDMIAWRGRCEVHEKFTVEDVNNARKQFPSLAVLAHPECSPEVVAASDYADSTSRMIDYVQKSDAERFLILTECSMGDNIIGENPDKEIVRMCSVRCPHMNQITLEDTLLALRENITLIELDENLRQRALGSVERMLEI